MRVDSTPLLGFSALLAALAVVAACGGESASGGAGSSGGAGGTGAGGGGAGSGGTLPVPEGPYPDLAALHELGISKTCALNQGVCHSARSYPELAAESSLAALVGAPCQLGAQTPNLVIDACELPGDRLVLGGVDHEILRVEVADDAPLVPTSVTVKLDEAPKSLDPTGARIRRLGAGGAELFSKALGGVQISAGPDAQRIVLALGAATDPTLAGFLDVRAWKGERVRMGDPNDDGKAHASPSPWAEIFPGDPARSFFYQRLVRDDYGPRMPLLQRTWTPEATRAVWCWIRGLPEDAAPATIDVHAPIDYANCPADPDAPDPNAKGSFAAVKTLLGSKCATATCHAAEARAGGLDLTPTPANVTASLVDIASAQAPSVLLVAPGEPSASYLLCKVDPSCAARAKDTGLMPLGAAALDEGERQTISAWIAAGAKVE